MVTARVRYVNVTSGSFTSHKDRFYGSTVRHDLQFISDKDINLSHLGKFPK